MAGLSQKCVADHHANPGQDAEVAEHAERPLDRGRCLGRLLRRGGATVHGHGAIGACCASRAPWMPLAIPVRRVVATKPSLALAMLRSSPSASSNAP